jgi:hypothetical protein
LPARSSTTFSRRADRPSEGGVATAARGPLQPIGVGPWLLAFLDQQRRTRFLETWLQIVNGT